jgi:hypothetical protein
MAGALTISTLNDSSGVLATQNGMSGIAKAWVNYNNSSGSSAVIRSSFNVSSVTYNGTGDCTINFTTAMPDANYTWTTSGGDNAQGLNYVMYYSAKTSTTAPTTTALRIQGTVTYNGPNNSAYNCVAIFR